RVVEDVALAVTRHALQEDDRFHVLRQPATVIAVRTARGQNCQRQPGDSSKRPNRGLVSHDALLRSLHYAIRGPVVSTMNPTSFLDFAGPKPWKQRSVAQPWNPGKSRASRGSVTPTH